jgi:hypothetical protein
MTHTPFLSTLRRAIFFLGRFQQYFPRFCDFSAKRRKIMQDFDIIAVEEEQYGM